MNRPESDLHVAVRLACGSRCGTRKVTATSLPRHCHVTDTSLTRHHRLALWDVRKLGRGRVQTLRSHEGEVLQVEWSPTHRNVLASAGGDGRVCVWDCSRIGAAQSAAEAMDGPPELLFIHGGHTDKATLTSLSNRTCDDSYDGPLI